MKDSALRLGIAPINWCNDDMPELGQSIALEQCFAEMREAGYRGTELGHKYPQASQDLAAVLARFDLQLAACWHSIFYADALRHKEQHESLEARLRLLGALGAKRINVAECSGTIHNQRKLRLSTKPMLSEEQWAALVKGLNEAGALCQRYGITLGYHHHMGTVVQTSDEIERLLAETDPALVSLCYDTGHLTWAGLDPLAFLERHHARVAHVHLKDVRRDVLKRHGHEVSFLDAVLEGIFTVPGDGMIDFRPILRLLRQSSYRGWLIVEAEQDPEKAHPLTYAKSAFSYLQGVMAPVRRVPSEGPRDAAQ